ncbi:peptidoglycan D,D-transpeptidase FtsI family protein [Liberibacter crescens]|nr:penicillin-binding protein 2 [Liberibacter crescens]AMC12801.1 cell division protein [Liberibacter crescens]
MFFVSFIIGLKSQLVFFLKNTVFSGNDQNTIGSKKEKKFIQSRYRIILVMLSFVLLYMVVNIKLIRYGFLHPEDVFAAARPSEWKSASRPDILDRNGEILATDIHTVSLYADPYTIIDPDEAVEKLATVLPDLDIKGIYRKLSSKSLRFQWLRRQLTPKQQSQIIALGIPGLRFRPEKRRFYPGGSIVSHVVGYVNVDNQGITGIEKFIDMNGLSDLSAAGLVEDHALEPVKLSIDLRVQSIVHELLVESYKKYNAEATGAVVLDVRSGEVLAMVSIPDYDPNHPGDGREDGWLNRISNGTFEMGSTFKAFTIAMGLDSGVIGMDDTVDVRYPIKINGFSIRDFHSKDRILTIPEIFQYSSNIGAAKIADSVGVDQHKEFLNKLGLLSRLNTELPEIKTPSQPSEWKKINSLTIAFGHGIATTPLQTAVAAAALVNGGYLIPPTFMLRNREEAAHNAQRVIKKSTCDDVRFLLRWNAINGSGKKALVSGFDVGGKTGTAQKVINGHYSRNLNFNSFLAVFPVNDPQYVVLVFIDSAKNKDMKSLTAGTNAVPLAGEIIRRSAAILGVKPNFEEENGKLLVGY